MLLAQNTAGTNTQLQTVFTFVYQLLGGIDIGGMGATKGVKEATRGRMNIY